MFEKRTSMRVFIPTAGRPNDISTHKLLGEAIDWYVVVHRQEEGEAYRANPSIPNNRLIVSTETKRTKNALSNWIIENLIDENEWWGQADDDIMRLEKLPEPEYSEQDLPVTNGNKYYWRDLYRRQCSAEEFAGVLEDIRRKAEQQGTCMGGFSGSENYFFRGKKWNSYSLARGALTVQKKTDLRFDIDCPVMVDYEWTAAHILKYGSVAIMGFANPAAKMYSSTGGLGNYSDRIVKKQIACKHIVEKYAGLLRINDNREGEPGTELSFILHDADKIARWQAEMLYKARGTA